MLVVKLKEAVLDNEHSFATMILILEHESLKPL